VSEASRCRRMPDEELTLEQINAGLVRVGAGSAG
jgi:hypothetical protein